MTANTPLDTTKDPARAEVVRLFKQLAPWDEQERADIDRATSWAESGAPLWRIRKPDVPAMHLVSYFVVLDEMASRIMLVAHRKAGLWLPTGGHVEPDEHPWHTVTRECREELYTQARPSTVSGDSPLFLTVTQTVGAGQHTDVSLWYVIQAQAHEITTFDEAEFSAIWWLSLDEVLKTSLTETDPHMHRFTRKLSAALPEPLRQPLTQTNT